MAAVVHGMHHTADHAVENAMPRLALHVPVSGCDRSLLREICNCDRRGSVLVYRIDRTWIRAARRQTGRAAGGEAGAR